MCYQFDDYLFAGLVRHKSSRALSGPCPMSRFALDDCVCLVLFVIFQTSELRLWCGSSRLHVPAFAFAVAAVASVRALDVADDAVGGCCLGSLAPAVIEV